MAEAVHFAEETGHTLEVLVRSRPGCISRGMCTQALSCLEICFVHAAGD